MEKEREREVKEGARRTGVMRSRKQEQGAGTRSRSEEQTQGAGAKSRKGEQEQGAKAGIKSGEHESEERE